MIRKILVALLSSLLLCAVLAWLHYTPQEQLPPNAYHWSFPSLLMIYLIYATPVYVLGGVPASLLIERLGRKLAWENALSVYLFRLLAYALAGCLLMLFFLLVSGEGAAQIPPLFSPYFGFGAAAALLYMHVWLISFLLVKERPWRW